MIPLPRILNYGNKAPINPTVIGYNFSESRSYGLVNISPNPENIPIDIPISNNTYSKMVHITNTTVNMIPSDERTIIGLQNFELRLVFYLYPGGTSYDELCMLKNIYSGMGNDNWLALQITDAGFNNRLCCVIGENSTSVYYTFNVTRVQLTNNVNDIIVRRIDGMVTASLNGVPLLMAVSNGEPTASTLPNNRDLQSRYLGFGEIYGGTAFGVNIGVIDFGLKIGDNI